MVLAWAWGNAAMASALSVRSASLLAQQEQKLKLSCVLDFGIYIRARIPMQFGSKPTDCATNRISRLPWHIFGPSLISGIRCLFVHRDLCSRSDQGPASQTYSPDHLWINSS